MKSAPQNPIEIENKTNLLSAREIEILSLIAKGFSSKQIAGLLCLSYDTVKNHRKNMLNKTKTNNMVQLLALLNEITDSRDARLQ